MTRFQLIAGPHAYPFFDIVNRDTRQENPVFDLGVVLEDYDGSVFVQIDHVQEMARSLGMITKEQADLLIEENQRLNKQLNALPERAQVLQNGMAQLVDNFRASLDVDNVGDSSVESSTTSESVESQTDGSESKSDNDDFEKLLGNPETDSDTSGQNDDDSSVERPASVRRNSKPKQSDSLFD